ncbi:tripartite tricarboxylate transporter substrate binding protein [Ideonella livida]|uniref:Tripartite tricarboxylate transporter substrate binding protein n=1 Tax=Ideonella livida TaxID=2707176 RepID=A0A7C9PJ40_9BURK|nr:tripartite tricarboxylate transporter substrate binding protein [Ideonella livida]NDY92511.1 tripartite tricarboxylate transporter substrate binding protein [Ideonella livida]
MSRRRFLTQSLAPLAALATLGAGLPAAAATTPTADAYPSRPITLVVPFTAGGATDTVGRIVAKALGDRLGQTVVVDNRPGAGTEVGAAAVARAPADGYTLLISSNSTFTVNPALKPRLQYSAEKSFEAVGMVGSSPLAVMALPSFPANSMGELLGQAKAKPGSLTYASFGTGTTAHLAGEMLKVMAGVDMIHVPYKGSAPAMADLLGGQVNLSVDTLVAALPMLRAGKVKVLATTGARRAQYLPQVPTVAESGMPQFEMVSWLAIVAPKGLPAPVSRTLSITLAAALSDSAVQTALKDAGLEVGFQPAAAYDARLARELPLLRAYVAKARITME